MRGKNEIDIETSIGLQSRLPFQTGILFALDTLGS
jgi:hypothetical protein